MGSNHLAVVTKLGHFVHSTLPQYLAIDIGGYMGMDIAQ